MATRGFDGETMTPATGGKYKPRRTHKRPKVRRGPGPKSPLVDKPLPSGAHPRKGAADRGKSFNAPGHVKKRLGLRNASSIAPGAAKRRRPTAPTSTPPHPRKANSMTGSAAGGTVAPIKHDGAAMRASAISRVRGNVAPVPAAAAGIASRVKRGSGGSAARANVIASARSRRAR